VDETGPRLYVFVTMYPDFIDNVLLGNLRDTIKKLHWFHIFDTLHAMLAGMAWKEIERPIY